jgi:hypothetical protein
MAWAKGEGCVNAVLSAAGGALLEAHKGQSMVRLEAATSSSPCTTSFMLPVLVQTKSMPCGFTTGDAMATPTDNANHTSTKRVIWRALRRRCMAELCPKPKTDPDVWSSATIRCFVDFYQCLANGLSAR